MNASSVKTRIKVFSGLKKNGAFNGSKEQLSKALAQRQLTAQSETKLLTRGGPDERESTSDAMEAQPAVDKVRSETLARSTPEEEKPKPDSKRKTLSVLPNAVHALHQKRHSLSLDDYRRRARLIDNPQMREKYETLINGCIEEDKYLKKNGLSRDHLRRITQSNHGAQNFKGLQVLMLGLSGVGKTSLCNACARDGERNDAFAEDCLRTQATIHYDHHVFNMETIGNMKADYLVNVKEYAGGDMMRNAHSIQWWAFNVVVWVADWESLMDHRTICKLRKVIDELELVNNLSHKGGETATCLVVTKLDTLDQEQKHDVMERAREFSGFLKAKETFYTSVRENEGVETFSGGLAKLAAGVYVKDQACLCKTCLPNAKLAEEGDVPRAFVNLLNIMRNVDKNPVRPTEPPPYDLTLARPVVPPTVSNDSSEKEELRSEEWSEEADCWTCLTCW